MSPSYGSSTALLQAPERSRVGPVIPGNPSQIEVVEPVVAVESWQSVKQQTSAHPAAHSRIADNLGVQQIEVDLGRHTAGNRDVERRIRDHPRLVRQVKRPWGRAGDGEQCRESDGGD